MVAAAGAAAGALTVSADVELARDADYHVRVTALNASGTVVSSDRMFYLALDGSILKEKPGGTPSAHPDHCFECGKGMSHQVTRDVAVVPRDHAVPTSKVARYAQLPQPRRVDALANRSLIDLVGYGVQFQQDLPGQR